MFFKIKLQHVMCDMVLLEVKFHEVSSNYLEVSKQQEKFGLYCWSLNDREKSTTSAFRSYKVSSKLCLVYL